MMMSIMYIGNYNNMRIFAIILFSALLFVLDGNAQEKALAKVHYKFRHINDTTKRDQPLRDDVVTYLGNHSSFYTSYTDNLIKADLDAQKLVSDYTGHLTVNFSTTPIKDFYLINSQSKSTNWMQAISSSFDIYVVESDYEVPKWVLLEDLKEIGGYRCQKAKTTFKGRVYTAWFTSEIPFHFGPWILHGLPGLIMSAEDEKGEVSFEYNGFDKISEKDEVMIDVPYYGIKASQAEIDKLKKVFEEDQSNYYKTLVSSGRFSIGSDFFGIENGKNTVDMKFAEDYKPSFKTNNPIEIVK